MKYFRVSQIFFSLILLMTSVIPMGLDLDFRMALSFYPAFSEEVPVTNVKLEGEWFENKEDSESPYLTIKKDEMPDSYMLEFQGEEKAVFTGNLFQLKNKFIFQTIPKELEDSSTGLSPWMYSYWGIEIQDEECQLYLISFDMAPMIKNSKIKIKHLEREDFWLITDSPDKIQKAIFKVMENSNASIINLRREK